MNETAGYGLIRPDAQNESDLFFHVTQLPPDTRLGRGDRVAYEAVPDTKKPGKMKAMNLRLLERQQRYG